MTACRLRLTARLVSVSPALLLILHAVRLTDAPWRLQVGLCSGVWLLHVLLLHWHGHGLPWGLLRLSLAEQRLQVAQPFGSESWMMTLNGSSCLPADLQDIMHGVLLQKAGGTRMPGHAAYMLAGSRGASAGRDCCTSPGQGSCAWLAGCFSRSLSRACSRAWL